MTGATAAQMGDAMTLMQSKMTMQHQTADHVEDNVDTLIAKLAEQGKNMKIMTEEEIQE